MMAPITTTIPMIENMTVSSNSQSAYRSKKAPFERNVWKFHRTLPTQPKPYHDLWDMLTRVALAITLLCVSACTPDRGTATRPEGAPTSAKTDVLKAGSKALQRDSPLDPLDVYLVGFHPMKDDPEHQMEAHHFCRQVNEDFAQCTLFDGNTRNANLNGIEYIISERLMEQLPAEERPYWHPHNGEILSGQLVAPGLPEAAEKELMRTKMNSYGKTWHTWSTSEGAKIPLGPAMLAWSFNRDGEIRPGLVEQRDKAMDIDTRDRREDRQDLQQMARPQYGVDAMKGKFARPTKDIPGVRGK